jgi:MFS transporter, Spinster family, sphingosine-1-phosphate transporter
VNLQKHSATRNAGDDYLIGRGHAWFAFAMTFALMLFDYMDRQVIVSLFPYMKSEWAVTDSQLGALVSVVSITVALAGIPVALIADRYSRVKSIAAMAAVWSLASISCMFIGSYRLLLGARALVGLGEAGYGSVGAALIASLFPARLRASMMATFFAAASMGSVLGVLVGGVIAARFGWRTAFGAVGLPGLVLAITYLRVRDYKTVQFSPRLTDRTDTADSPVKVVMQMAKSLIRARTMVWVWAGDAAQLAVVSALWAWLPSYLTRVQGIAAEQASIKAATVVLCGAFGSMAWGYVIDRAGAVRARYRLYVVSSICIVASGVLCAAFLASLAPGMQFLLVAVGGFLVTCTAGSIAAVVIDVVHPGMRSTGSAVLSLFRNLFGLAAGPLIAGALSDAYGLRLAMAITPLLGIAAAACFLAAAGSYEKDLRNAGAAEEIIEPKLVAQTR